MTRTVGLLPDWSKDPHNRKIPVSEMADKIDAVTAESLQRVGYGPAAVQKSPSAHALYTRPRQSDSYEP